MLRLLSSKNESTPALISDLGVEKSSMILLKPV